MNPRLYFRQVLAGRDTARSDMMARQMVNFQYLIGDRETGDALIVDPAYDIGGLFDLLEADGMRLSGVLVTHYHPDHIGGNFMGMQVQGLGDVLARASVPIHCQREEAAGVMKVTGISHSDMTLHDGGDTLLVGDVPIELLHTPGHTPGSQCFFVDEHLVAGDTLFLEGCGRVDLPGSDAEALYYSITQTLAKVPDTATLFPGHLYAPEPFAYMGEVRASNYVYRFKTIEQWKMMFGG